MQVDSNGNVVAYDVGPYLLGAVTVVTALFDRLVLESHQEPALLITELRDAIGYPDESISELD